MATKKIKSMDDFKRQVDAEVQKVLESWNWSAVAREVNKLMREIIERSTGVERWCGHDIEWDSCSNSPLVTKIKALLEENKEELLAKFHYELTEKDVTKLQRQYRATYLDRLSDEVHAVANARASHDVDEYLAIILSSKE